MQALNTGLIVTSSPLAIQESVCRIINTWSTANKYVASTNVRSTSSVTRAPALRTIVASNDYMLTTAKGLIRESIHVATAKPRHAVPVNSSSFIGVAYFPLDENTSTTNPVGNLLIAKYYESSSASSHNQSLAGHVV